MEFFQNIGKKISSAAQGVQEKTTDSIESSKIAGELRSIHADVQKLYTTLGEVYYKTAADSAEGELLSICRELDRFRDREQELLDRKQEIAMKGHCPTCGKPVKSGSRFCPNCGTKVEEEKPEEPAEAVCPECGEAARPGMRFCANCGHAFNEDEQSAVNLKNAAEEPADPQE